MADKPQPLTDHEWGKQQSCTDQSTGRIGVFTLLRLIANYNGIYNGKATVFKDSTIISCLREADPQMKWWHLEQTTINPDIVVVWRRLEYNQSLEKQRVDAEKKAVALITQAEYNHAKETVMEFMMLMCDGDKRAAEKMFYGQGLANDQQKLIKKAQQLSGMKEKHEAEACSEERVEQLSKFGALSRKLKGK